MPKILENIRENLLQEAKKQVMELGYSAMTIRSVAGACGVGVGTVYNYFPSKDNLVANFMLEDWQVCLDKMWVCCKESNPEKVLQGVYEVLRSFVEKYTALFEDENAGAGFATSFPQRHKMLRNQLAEPMEELCRMQTKADPHFLAEFIAETMLTWTTEGCEYEKISSVLLPLFQ